MSNPVKKKKRPPKYLEKMLLVNHKEDQLLQERLDHIHIRSRTREMELERERIKVRDEWKESRRRQIPKDSLPALSPSQNSPLSFLPQRKLGTVEKPKFNRATSLPDGRDSDNVNSYLLGEYRRMSEVIPSILLALSKKDEKKTKLAPPFPLRKIEEIEHREQEPDLHRITKLARSVKKMRENMSFQKKIDMNRPRLSLSKMFKDMHDHRNEIDQYTDGTCVLLKRKLEKRRRESMPELDVNVLPMRKLSDTGEASAFHKSQSAPVFSVSSDSTDPTTNEEAEETDVFETNLLENLPSQCERSKSLQFTPSLHRHHTSLEKRGTSSVRPHGYVDKRSSISAGLTRAPSSQMHPKRHSIPADFNPIPTRLPRFNPQNPIHRPSVSQRRFDSHTNTEFIDEDELRSKQRVAIELKKFERIQRKVDRFLIFDKTEKLGLKRGYTLLT
ncbi:uncharacterized protein LOC125675452 [Ostrea edulis]|uniref:uncharacterized protein LOC125675452 n=1 Tax=Ostrea edulis TaxID=37623 RepID=UPI0024AF18DC|nr:uncharacterized protein LOC125675452 [Ostrea edulis]XP_048769059.2 uncharacterized protein LOC125675452 [Ostrea edulis]XP_056014782.1 uncharacterized protein LOC125675452 [Ostrea edulis]